MMSKKQLISTILGVLKPELANLHTVAIGKVSKVGDKLLSVDPVIQWTVAAGEFKSLTTFTEVPPIFMRGGSSYTAHPIAVGDYCLLVITERCYDRWYAGQDFAPPAEYRMHDYSDGFALVGIGNAAGLIDIPDVIQQTGDTNLDGDYTHQGNMIQTGDLTVNGDLRVDGDIVCTGKMTMAEARIGGIEFGTHTHSGVTTGPSNTGGPN